MTPIDDTPSKSEILLELAIAAHIPDPSDADTQASLRNAFEAIISAVRKLDGIPAADIDQFVQDARTGAGADVLMAPAIRFATALPDEDYHAAVVNSGVLGVISAAKPAHHPKFVEAMERLKELQDRHGEAVMELPENEQLWAQVFEYAPPEFMQAVHDVATEMDLLPQTKYVNDAGEPLYSAEQIAEKFGIPVEQVERDIREKLGNHLPVGNVHLVQ